MRTVPEALQTHLDSGATTICRCWRLGRADGLVMGFTDHDEALSFDGVTFEAVGGVEATADVAHAGLNVGGLEIAGALSSASLDPADLANGVYDGAAVSLWMVNWQDVAQRLLLRRGTLGEVRRTDYAFEAEVRGPMQALETVRGRIYTGSCDADLGDERCAVLLTDFAVSVIVTSVDHARVQVTGAGGSEPGYFTHGVARVSAGEAAGVSVAISHDAGGTSGWLTLRQSVAGLAVGDSLKLTPGCDKSWATCRAKFGNGANYQGFPFLPGNDQVFSYARSGG